MPSTVISRVNKEVIASCNRSAAIATLATNGSYAFLFSCWQASISSRTGNHHPMVFRIKLAKFPIASIVHSLPLCDEVSVALLDPKKKRSSNARLQ